MSKLSGAFSLFKNLDKISADSINKWLRIKKDNQYLLNFLGNRIIYPQTIAVSPEDMEIDLAILREALKLEPERFYSEEKKLIEVPEEFINRFVPEFKLLAAVIDGIRPKGLIEIVLKGNKVRKILASFYLVSENILSSAPQQVKEEKDLIEAMVEGIAFKLLPNTLTLIPCKGGELDLKIDGKEPVKFKPGDIGIFIDLRSSYELS